jgi:hypothetical protein
MTCEVCNYIYYNIMKGGAYYRSWLGQTGPGQVVAGRGESCLRAVTVLLKAKKFPKTCNTSEACTKSQRDEPYRLRYPIQVYM